MTATGCSGGPDPEDIVTRTSQPSSAGGANFRLPDTNPLPLPSQSIAYEHKGTSDYSAASTQLYTTDGESVNGWNDRPTLRPLDYWKPAVINKRAVSTGQNGSFFFRANYVTISSQFSEPNGVRQVMRDRTFSVCQIGRTPQCNATGGFARNPASIAGKAIQCDSESGNCSGGGGGGSSTVPWYRRTTKHTAAMGPFFSTANGSGSVSQGQIEDMLEDLSPDQIDGIADIVWEAYGEDVHDYFGAEGTTSSDATSSGDGNSSFRALMEPLAALDRSSLWGPRRVALDRLLSGYDEYVAVRNTQTSAGKSGGDAGTSPFASHDQPTASGAAIWPNPATSRLNVSLPEGGGAVAVYDVAGRRVASLPAQAGERAIWDLRAGGRRVAAGVYQIVVTARDGARTTHTATVR